MTEPNQSTPIRRFHAMAKPAGSDCNLRCAYCFYLEKAALYPDERRRRMPDEVLERYVKSYIEAIRDEDEVAFTWQGGEPTLAGLDFFRRAAALQHKYGAGRKISNSFQTNGLLLNDRWCEFLKKHDFLVGLSLDGPGYIHDEYRLTAGDFPSHKLALRALGLLRSHGVRHNVLACVNRRSARAALRVYDYLCDAGAEYIQFLPVVERPAAGRAAELGLALNGPGGEAGDAVTEWSALPEEYGKFLTDIFDLWVRRDVGKVFVMNFEWALANFLGRPGAVCHHQSACGRSVIVEHNGDVYACDHFVYPEYRRGNLMTDTFAAMLDSPEQTAFGTDKGGTLTAQCRACPVLGGCWGGCPKHRFARADDGEAGHNYLCRGFRHFFGHVAPYLKIISILLENGRPASEVMQVRLAKPGELPNAAT